MPAKKKVTPKRTASRAKKATKSKAATKKTARKTGARVYSDRYLKTEIAMVDSGTILQQLTR